MKNKKKRMKRYMVYIAALALVACSGAKTADEDEAGVATMLPAESNEVTVQVLEKKVFEHELVSNGKLVAGKQGDSGVGQIPPRQPGGTDKRRP